jgi:hypothetical protein
VAKSGSKAPLAQRLRPQELSANVEGVPCAGDRLTAHDLHVVGKLATFDDDAKRRDRANLQTPVRFNQTP